MRTTAKTMQQYSEEGGNQKVTALESALSKFLVKVADEIESCFTEV